MNQVMELVPMDKVRACEVDARNRWSAQLAQLLTVPLAVPVTLPVSPYLKPVSRRTEAKRTWITSSSPATLLLLQRPASTVLVVSLKGNIHEEHYVSNLHFCWSQISCCQGSRLVFASYRDHLDEVQKFGLRFSTSFDAQSFLDSLKECSKTDKIASNDCVGGNNLPCEISHHSEFSVSTGPSYRVEDESSFASEADVYYPLMLPLATKHPHQAFPSQLNSVDVLESIFGKILPSFAELLNAYCTRSSSGFEDRQLVSVPDAGLTPTGSVTIDAEKTNMTERPGLTAAIADYMRDPSFQDAMRRVEEVWDTVESIYRPQ